nr:MAG TPA: hypothetical protein [Caudoviricetes sp.]DAK75837.1 MAG TPA: hypothetical protein [Caudoviricetes sp.]
MLLPTHLQSSKMLTGRTQVRIHTIFQADALMAQIFILLVPLLALHSIRL